MPLASVIGGFLFTPLLSYAVHAWGWRRAAFLAGVTFLLIGLPLALFVRRSPESMGLRPDGDSAEYRHAPEHKVPAALDDAYAAYKWVLANTMSLNGDPNKVAVMGESAGGNLAADLNPNSLEALGGCRLEPLLAATKPGAVVQFERQGYFGLDPDSKPGDLLFNRTVGLRDTWAKVKGGT